MLRAGENGGLGRRLRRARRLGGACGRIALGAKASLLFERWSGSRLESSWVHRRAAAELSEAAISLGGLVLKGAQYLGARPDRLPDEYIESLSALQDRLPGRPFPEILPFLEEELDGPVAGTFSEFERLPAAAGSLAQVHRARLKDGRRVAVKIQYPEVAGQVQDDLANLKWILQSLAVLDPRLDLAPLLEELAEVVPKELDFRAEADNARRFREAFADRPDLVIPEVLIGPSTSRILVLDWIEGLRITDGDGLRAAGIDPSRLLHTLGDIYAEQFFVHGFFHADPHPGNLRVIPGETDNRRGHFRLALFDFGLARPLPSGFRRILRDVVAALLRGERSGLRSGLYELGLRDRRGGVDDLEALIEQLAGLGAALRTAGPSSPRVIHELRREILVCLRAHPLGAVPVHLVLMVRTLGLLAGLAKNLGARVDLYSLLAAKLLRPEVPQVPSTEADRAERSAET